ncbi:hypothetical protein ASA1KI_44750 [Opitutales bacterium ASA1]|uniref:hypothetical protein n=1 Tax=Congregicoccus parvus TaxID=3081749 RepID=UPI002B2E71B0|nr:hypothetical protein ASA1KI_44750 [Opitutales bacterium ASA1]
MRYHISPLRYAFEGLLDLVGLGPRHSVFTAARNTESRVRFAQYLDRVQPAREHGSRVGGRRTARFLGGGGALSRGVVRHAPSEPHALPVRTPAFRQETDLGARAAARRSSGGSTFNSLRFLLHALRVR